MAGRKGRRPVQGAMETSYQLLKAARAAIGMSNVELARKAGVSKRTLVRIEAHQSVSLESRLRVQAVFEAEGIEFLPSDSERGPGLRIACKLIEKPGRRRSERMSE